jgi:hypothetical protein
MLKNHDTYSFLPSKLQLMYDPSKIKRKLLISVDIVSSPLSSFQCYCFPIFFTCLSYHHPSFPFFPSPSSTILIALISFLPSFLYPIFLSSLLSIHLINKKNETTFVRNCICCIFTLLLVHVSAYIGHPQVLRTQNVKKNHCMQY